MRKPASINSSSHLVSAYVVQRVRGLTGPNPFHSQALRGMFYCYPCSTDVGHHITCLRHGGRAGLPGEYGEIDLRGQEGVWEG